ncbi:MAG: flavodoxin family protein [Lachnospiraceae bacterium]|nr:flavodoxin family protein [Lachnospiraceae bacterium]
MKKIVAINASPRKGWNTWSMVNEASEGARSKGTEVQFFDLYKLDKHAGCMSCFACKREKNAGKCVFPDGLAPVLEAIREADGLIIGSPNYLGDVSSEFHALYERLIFQTLTYKKNPSRYDYRRIPVLFIMTSNANKELYMPLGYKKMLKRYQDGFNDAVGNTKMLVAGNTLQVKDYSQFDWTIFDPQAKQEYHDNVFPKDLEKAFDYGVEMVDKAW